MTYCRCYSCKYLLRYELKTECGQICAFFNCRSCSSPVLIFLFFCAWKCEELACLALRRVAAGWSKAIDHFCRLNPFLGIQTYFQNTARFFVLCCSLIRLLWNNYRVVTFQKKMLEATRLWFWRTLRFVENCIFSRHGNVTSHFRTLLQEALHLSGVLLSIY